jgi:hypothetical protein
LTIHLRGKDPKTPIHFMVVDQAKSSVVIPSRLFIIGNTVGTKQLRELHSGGFSKGFSGW